MGMCEQIRTYAMATTYVSNKRPADSDYEVLFRSESHYCSALTRGVFIVFASMLTQMFEVVDLPSMCGRTQ